MTTITPALDVDEVTTQLFATLHKGGTKFFLQRFTKDGKRRSIWRNVNGKPMTIPRDLQQGENVYFGVNPTCVAVTDRDRTKFTKDGITAKDSYIEQYVGSKNDTVAAANCVFTEIDGKDFTLPSDDEIAALVPVVKAEKQAMLDAGEFKKIPSDAAIRNEAVGRAKQAKYITDPQHYNALALAHLKRAPLQASVCWCSGGGYQAVWLFDTTFVIDSAEARAWIQWLQGAWVGVVGGDDGAKDIRRILRLPGTQNVKKHWAPNYPTVSYEWADFTLTYTLSEIASHVPPRPAKVLTAHPVTTTNGHNNGTFEGESVIDRFNATYKIEDMLDEHGYTGTGTERSRPGQPGSNGVNIDTNENCSWHWSSNDPLYNPNSAGNPHKTRPFAVFLTLEHGGDLKRAVRTAAELLDMGYEKDNFDGFAQGLPQTGAELLATLASLSNGIGTYTNGDSATTPQSHWKLQLTPGQKVRHTKDGQTKVVTIKSLVMTGEDGVNLYAADYVDEHGAHWPTTIFDNDDIALIAAEQAIYAATGEIVDSQLLDLSLDALLAAIESIGQSEYTSLDPKPEANAKKAIAARKERIIKELSVAIGNSSRGDRPLIVDALTKANADFKPTAAANFINGCAADVKKARKMAKAAQRSQHIAKLKQARTKRVIDTNDRQIDDLAAETLEAIQEYNLVNPSNPILYSQNGKLVKVVKAGDRYVLLLVESDQLLSVMGQVADWTQESQDEDGNEFIQNVFPPSQVVKAFAGRGEWPGLHEIFGVTTCPTFAPDGTLHCDYGYSAKTNLFYTGGVTLGDTTPTPANVVYARSLLFDDLFVDFPFDNEASKAHLVALAIQPIVRGMIDGPTPLHLIDAPVQGSGKGLAVAAALIPALGSAPVSYPGKGDDEDEWRKALTSCLISGSAAIVFDNLTGTLNAPALAIALSEPVYGDRILGSSGNAQIPVRVTWAATANNVSLGDDIIRRTVWTRLDANQEDPSKRTGFKHENLKVWAKENRDALLTALITLVNQWIADGRPAYKGKIKGSYESWCAVIGGILQSAGIAGFLSNDDELRKVAFNQGDAIGEFVAEWARQYGKPDRYGTVLFPKVTVMDLFPIASHNDDIQWTQGDPLHPTPVVEHLNILGDMLGSKKPQGRKTALGMLLGQTLRDKVIRGFKVVKSEKLSAGSVTYTLIEVVPGSWQKVTNDTDAEGAGSDMRSVADAARLFSDADDGDDEDGEALVT